jgi:hypothetical protein
MDIPTNTERKIRHSDVEDFNDIDTRVSAIECLYPNIIGVNENEIEWCPNEEPPTKEEYLAWLWVIQPSVCEKIMQESSEELTKLMVAYNSNKMESWFEYIAT